MHFCSSPKVDSTKRENSRGILYLKLAISGEIMEKIRDKESRGNNDMICPRARVTLQLTALQHGRGAVRGGGGGRAHSSRLFKMVNHESRQIILEFHASREIT